MSDEMPEAADIEVSEERLVEEGWYHPNVKSGQVHDHDFSKQPQTMHRLCVPVYTKHNSTSVVLRMAFIDAIGVYKIALGFGDDDEDVLRVRAALQVQLSAVVGP